MAPARALMVLALVACRDPRPAQQVRGLVAAQCLCPCAEDAEAGVEADAAVDAPFDVAVDASPDAAPAPSPDAPPLDLTAPWTRTVITPGAPTGLYRGADGVARDPEGCWVTPWEEGGIVTRACRGPSGWVTELVASGLPGVEDARAADLDGDGVVDVVACSDAGARCYAIFRGAPNVVVTLPGSQGHNHMMQAAIADLTGDGLPDIVVGSRYTTTGAREPAALVLLTNPGTALARDGAAWAPEVISRAGWTMTLVVADGRVVVSDRAAYLDDAGATKWDLYGSRWLARTPSGSWTSSHPIAGGACPVPLVNGVCSDPTVSAPAGSCPAGQPLCSTRTPGDEMFARVVGADVWDCTSRLTGPNRVAHHHNAGDWLTWSHVVLPEVPNVGHCQGVLVTDLDHDGRDDVVVSAWKDNAFPVALAVAGESGVYGLRDDGAGGWQRVEISGPTGGKFDNVEVLNSAGCLITSEQLDPQGGLGVVAYCPPGAVP